MPSANAAKTLAPEEVSLEQLFALADDKSSAGRQTLFENMRDMFLDGGSSVSDRE